MSPAHHLSQTRGHVAASDITCLGTLVSASHVHVHLMGMQTPRGCFASIVGAIVAAASLLYNDNIGVGTPKGAVILSGRMDGRLMPVMQPTEMYDGIRRYISKLQGRSYAFRG